ncbi:MAG: hypothetical protein AB7H97_18905 [Pseudobdellovibrionaceae bacterium]
MKSFIYILSSLFFTNPALAESSKANVSVNTGALDAILQASLVVQLTLLSLIGLSVLCWAVGYIKWQQFKAIRLANEPFANKFWKATSLDAVFESLDAYKMSPLARVYKHGYLEMQKLAETTSKKEGSAQIQLSG